MFALDFAALSDRGLVRGNNEDSAYAGPHLLALADGMGGHAAGEIASQIMINHLMRFDQDPEDNDMLALLASGADEANQAIAEGIQQAPETDGMGTTLTAFMFNGHELAMCHVGDSRAYRLRDGVLKQLTVDDTYVQSLVDSGDLDPEEVSTHPQRSMILKAYAGRYVEPTLRMFDVQRGDRILLCSDGLSDPVTHSTIETALQDGPPEAATQRLVGLALRSGGPDNVTVIVADVVEAETETEAKPKPHIVGALNATQQEDPRPDTAAGRAALAIQQRQSEVIPPELPKQKSRGKFIALISVLCLVIAVIVGGWWLYHRAQNTYHISTTGEEANLIIQRGSTTYQHACLSSSGDLTMIDTADAQDCHYFRLADLKETTRAEVSSLSKGSYNEVLQQMQQLADDALPVCVKRSSGASAPGDLTSPGVNCREVS